MQVRAIVRSIVVGLLLVLGLVLWASCGSDSNNGGGVGPDGGVVGPMDDGLCRSTCTKDCVVDQDCEVSTGELCGDLGPAGHTCLKAALCPRFCTDDSKCDVSMGQACVRATLSTPDKVCTQPAKGLLLCSNDQDCKTGNVCCKNYKEPICLPPGQCPKACTGSTDCSTDNNEVCCDSVAVLEPNLAVSGLCLNTTATP